MPLLSLRMVCGCLMMDRADFVPHLLDVSGTVGGVSRNFSIGRGIERDAPIGDSRLLRVDCRRLAIDHDACDLAIVVSDATHNALPACRHHVRNHRCRRQVVDGCQDLGECNALSRYGPYRNSQQVIKRVFALLAVLGSLGTLHLNHRTGRGQIVKKVADGVLGLPGARATAKIDHARFRTAAMQHEAAEMPHQTRPARDAGQLHKRVAIEVAIFEREAVEAHVAVGNAVLVVTATSLRCQLARQKAVPRYPAARRYRSFASSNRTLLKVAHQLFELLHLLAPCRETGDGPRHRNIERRIDKRLRQAPQ